MKTVSRRKFMKSVLAGLSVLTTATFFSSASAQNKDVTLSVDEDGNAILQGAAVIVDKNCNAIIKQEGNGQNERN